MIVVLLGAQLNAEIEHQTAKDLTVGPDKPLGRRGASRPIRLEPHRIDGPRIAEPKATRLGSGPTTQLTKTARKRGTSGGAASPPARVRT